MAELKEVTVGSLDEEAEFFVGREDSHDQYGIDKCVRPKIAKGSVSHINLTGGAVLVMNLTKCELSTLHITAKVYVIRD